MGAPRRDRGVHDDTTTHTAAVTPESLRPCLDRGGIGTPRGRLRAHDTFHPHTAAVTPESLRSYGRAGIGTPRGGLWAHGEIPPPHSGSYTRVPPVLPGPRRDRDAPWKIAGARHVPPPHSGSYTRVPPVLPAPRRDRDAPWGIVGTRRGPSPKQRRLHPSPSGPAKAAEG